MGNYGGMNTKQRACAKKHVAEPRQTNKKKKNIMQKIKKMRVGILFGGKSAEHEVSLLSAKNVIEALDKERFEPVLIGIDKEGTWHLNDAEHFLLNSNNPKLIALNKNNNELSLTLGVRENQISVVESKQNIGKVDVIFLFCMVPMEKMVRFKVYSNLRISHLLVLEFLVLPSEWIRM